MKIKKIDVITNLKNSNLEIIDIEIDQMCSFLGNCIQLVDSKSNPLLVMSSRALTLLKTLN